MNSLDNYIDKIKKEPRLLKNDEVEELLNSSKVKNKFFYIRHIAAVFVIAMTVTFFFFQNREKNILNRMDNQIARNDLRYVNFIHQLSNNPEILDVGLVRSNSLQDVNVPIDQSALLSLSEEKLRRIGFHIYETGIIYQANIESKGSLMFWVTKESPGVSVNDQHIDSLNTYDFYPLYLSDLDGKQQVSYYFSAEPKNKREMFSKQINSLIPILIKVPNSEKQKIFWFLPTENFLNILEEGVFNSESLVSDFTLKKSKKLNIYPNPAKDSFQIDADFLDNSSKIELLDMQGNSIRDLEPNGFSMNPNSTYKFNVAGINKGIYLLAVSSKSNSPIYKRLIITD